MLYRPLSTNVSIASTVGRETCPKYIQRPMAGEAGENIHKTKKGQGGSSEVLVSSNACEASCVIGLQLSKYRERRAWTATISCYCQEVRIPSINTYKSCDNESQSEPQVNRRRAGGEVRCLGVLASSLLLNESKFHQIQEPSQAPKQDKMYDTRLVMKDDTRT